MVSLIQSQLPRLRIGPRVEPTKGLGLYASRTAASCSRSIRDTPMPTRRASGRFTRSSRPSSRKTASRGSRFGVMGGDMQPQGHVQVLVNMIDFGMGLQQAGDAARFHHDGSTEPLGLPSMSEGGVVQLETGVPQAVADELIRRGHKAVYTPGTPNFGGYQAILRDPQTGVYWGASEFRKDGLAGGY